jgi:hypothetical protein
MALGNGNTSAQARGKNIAIKVKKEQDRVAREGEGGREGGGR